MLVSEMRPQLEQAGEGEVVRSSVWGISVWDINQLSRLVLLIDTWTGDLQVTDKIHVRDKNLKVCIVGDI